VPPVEPGNDGPQHGEAQHTQPVCSEIIVLETIPPTIRGLNIEPLPAARSLPEALVASEAQWTLNREYSSLGGSLGVASG
jgi:hypothetical protein